MMMCIVKNKNRVQQDVADSKATGVVRELNITELLIVVIIYNISLWYFCQRLMTQR